MYKIFFNNKPLYLVSELNAEMEEYLHHEDTVFIDDFNQHTVKAMIHEMEAPQIHAGVFKHDDVEALMKAFRKRLVVVQAAGGLVHTPSNEILPIHTGQYPLQPGEEMWTVFQNGTGTSAIPSVCACQIRGRYGR